MSSNSSARTQPCSPAVVAINAKMAHLAQNLSITELNNNAVDALKEGNLPHAFCCIFQATSCTKKERQIAQSQRSKQQRQQQQQHLRHAQQSVKQGQQQQQQRQAQQLQQQQQPPVELPSIDPPSDKHSSTTTTTTTSDDTTAETSQVADVTDRQTSSSSSSSTCRFEWVDVLKHTESYRDVRKRWQETDAHRLRYRGHGIGTEFLCVRPIRIVDVDSTVVPPSDCAWVIWYNAAMIYHLIADELGESVQRLLAESHRLLLLVTHCIDRDHLGGLSKLMNVSSSSSSSSSPWRTALLCAWHNHACLYYERAQLNEMKRMMRLLYRVIARNWKTTTTSSCDDQDDRWVTKTNSSGRHLFRQMALHARILCGHRCAGVA